MLRAAIAFFVDRREITLALALLLAGSAVYVAPFPWELPGLSRSPVPVDAIPNLGDNQQVVTTEWPGRSPRDIDDQITYPLSTALLGIPGVRTVRASSTFGLSTLYIVFDDRAELYWSRSRVLEKLASLPSGTLPEGVTPTLGPDATALGQIFWYTLEARDPEGRTVAGFDPDELRSVQDWTVRFALQSVDGVSEVASVGGFVREYQVDVDPEAMRARGVTLAEAVRAVQRSNQDVGARTLEINSVEYLVRGLGFVKSVDELEQSVVRSSGGTPIRIGDVARVALGPAPRRGALDDAGAPAVGGVVVARAQASPLEVIERVKAKIEEISPGLPKRRLADGTLAQVEIVPFYDRSELILDTLGTLSSALLQQILVSVVVVVFMLRSLIGAGLIGLLLPMGVGLTFVAMRLTGVSANVMALGGIAVSIGTMVDVGIVFVENIRQRESLTVESVTDAAHEVAPAVMTSVLTTVISFLPVFGLPAAELRLFGPLALTKTYAMGAALLLGMTLVPALSRFGRGTPSEATLGAREWIVVALGTVILSFIWRPLGEGAAPAWSFLFVAVCTLIVLWGVEAFRRVYPRLLPLVLQHRRAFLAAPALTVVLALAALPTFGREHLPPFDEGAFLYMPTTMPHASLGQVLDMLQGMDAAIAAIPEVDRVVGKIGRVESALDPAPISMVETVITYHPEYETDANGERTRRWRDHIRSPDDIWREIVTAAEWPGATGAPKLMPIQARLVMLQSGMRAPMGLKVRGPDLETLERFGVAVEKILEGVPELRPETVFADRVVGKPYLEIEVDRAAAARYGLAVADVQDVVQVALGGATVTRTVEGRARYPVRVRYMREERDSIDALERVAVATPGGESIPLAQVASFSFERGPQMIRSEDTFLTSYVIFDAAEGVPSVTAVERAREALERARTAGELEVPTGVSYEFAGEYEQQLASEARLRVLVPLALLLVFVVLQLQFRSFAVSAIIYAGVVVALSGGVLLLFLYGQPWFLNVELFGFDPRQVFNVDRVDVSVAVWVGFIALVGLATDDGVVMATYLRQRFDADPPSTPDEVRERVLEAGIRRVRPCLMTTATTLLALLPVITASGKGADLMLPIALPMFGGMTLELLTLFVVPTLYAWREERRLDRVTRARPLDPARAL